MNSQCHVLLRGPLGWKVFQSPYSAREYEKALCACASFCVCKWINCNSICPVFLRTSMRWRFLLLIGLDWGAKLRVTFLRNIGARLVTASLARWFDGRIFSNDSSMYQIHPICKMAIFQFPHSLVAKDIQDSLVSKRWKDRIYDKIHAENYM